MHMMLDAGRGWRLNLLTLLVAIAPFTPKIVTGRWASANLQAVIGLALVILVTLVVAGLREQRWRPDRVDIVAYVWLLAVSASALASDSVDFGLSGAARFSVAMLLVPATRSVVKSSADVRRLLVALLVGTSLGSLIGLVVWVSGGAVDSTRIFFGDVTTIGPFNRLTRPWPHANGAAMVIGATVAAAALIRPRVVRWGAIVMLTVALVLTISRGGVAAGLAAGALWVALRRCRSTSWAVAGLILVGVVTVAFSSAWTTRLDTPGDRGIYGSSIEAPAAFALDRSATDVEVTVTNLSAVTWEPDGPDRVLISARWIGPDGLVWTEDWWRLPDTLDPGQSVTTGLTIEPRVPVGDGYRVRWDLLIEQTAYFGQFLGDDPVWSAVDVATSTVALADITRVEFVPRLIEIGRRAGWSLAWDEFVANPILGVGPSQFGRHQAAELRVNGQIAPAHAHNVVLEPLATWGLLGTVPFAILGIGGFARIVRRAWRTRQREACVVAVGLFAIAVHGVVDWPLVQAATRIPVGLLLGLAWVDWSRPMPEIASVVGSPAEKHKQAGPRV